MNEFRLILYIIIIAISLYNLFTYNSRKRTARKRAQLEKEAMISSRVLTDEEKEALESIHKVKIAPGSPVYEVEGQYDSHSLRVKSGTITTHYLGAFQVLWDNIFNQYLEPVNKGEVVFPEKDKGCLLISLNSRYTAIGEAKIRRHLSGNAETDDSQPVNSGEAQFRETRKATEEEKKYLSKDFRVIACFGVFTGLLLLPYSFPGIYAIAAIGLVLFSLGLLIKEEYPLGKNRFHENLLSITGVLKSETPQSGIGFSIDRFALSFPKGWDNDLPVDSVVTVEAYPLTKDSSSLNVLSISSGRSVQMDQRQYPTKNVNRYILLSVFLFINLVILLSANGGASNLGRLYGYLSTRDLQKTFTTFDEIRDYDFKKGQEVVLKGQKIVPRYIEAQNGEAMAYGQQLIPSDRKAALDLEQLRNRIRNLQSLQLTDVMISMAAFRSYDSLEYYDFLIANGTKANSLEMDAFGEVFSDNPDWIPLMKMAELLFDEEESSSEELTSTQIVASLDNFIKSESEILSRMLGSSLLEAIPDDEHIQLYGLETWSDLITIRPADLLSFNRGYSYNANNKIEYVTPLNVVKNLDELDNYIKKSDQLTDLKGVIVGKRMLENGYKELNINLQGHYKDLEAIIATGAVLSILVLLLIFSLTLILKTIINQNRQ